VLVIALIASACGSSAPTTPTPAPAPIVAPTPPAPTIATISDAGGAFSFDFSPFQGNLRVTLVGSGIVTRVATAAVNATLTQPR